MKMLKIIVIFVLIFMVLSSTEADNPKGEVLAVLRTPAGMTLTEESLKDGKIRRYIEAIAESENAKVMGVFDSLSLANKDGNIFVFFVSDSKTSEELAEALRANPNVVSASPNRQNRLL
ncbi:MAG: hypothetical protein IJP97_00875 [Synergistaceae bacterium]|nr:hypothetical protein [Synergistaceae bacterium]MBQ3693827.1 hypothetical protein [Synergistaceae bacterium]MBQ9629861.1 hypothetical protein [Synergistaceae bacterium]MBR0069027.1 hypothetical protein [Synergistaceae bacterium]MBR0251126.1 hypothetical protein [Synergistaceae bacterium]